MTWRTIHYYKSLGLIPSPVPRSQNPKGDKRGHYPRTVLVYFRTYYFLQNHLGFTLAEIKRLIKKLNFVFLTDGLSYYKEDLIYKWITVTYSQFFETAYKELRQNLGGEKEKLNTIEAMLGINYLYKEALRKIPGKYTVEIHKGTDIKPAAKRWVDRQLSR